MKKSAFIIALLFVSFLGFGQNEMPYYIMYQMQGDTVYRNLQSVDSIHIDSTGQQFVLHNGTDWVSLSDSDTVYIFRDKFRRYVGEIGDWDDVVFSMEQICFYKESNVPGVPRALLNLYVNDSIPDGYFVFTKFDEEGNPDFVNFNDTCFMKVNRYYGEYYDATVMSSDMSIMTMDSIRMEESLDRIQERVDALGRAGYAISPLGRAFARQRCVLGGASMVMGTAGMMIGCAMLIPGVNIAMGVTIAIAGAATFVSGAMTVTRATDQLLSDGSHTEGFAETSTLLGLAGSATSIFGLLSNLFMVGVIDGYEQALLQAEANWPHEREQQIRSMELSATGRATLLDMNNYSIRLFGTISEKLNSNDRFGIMICRDRDALTVEDCQLLEASHPTGEFYCDFSGLEPCGGYYYRSYYYSTELASFGSEFNPNVVSAKKSFKMPGVITLGHEQSGFSFSYNLFGEFQDVANQPSHIVGFCYSYTNTTPTFDDHVTQKTVSNNGEFSDHVFLDSDFTRCYYRAYAFINGEIAYGEVRQIGVEVTTYMAENVTATTATCWGEVVCEECEVTERGICWSTSHNPTTSGSHINEGQGTGFYSCSLTGLTPGTTYYARAYAIVGSRTLYGNEVTFTTQEDEPTPGDWVDLGLPSGLLWATRNVGASSPEDYGSYFAWGETSPKSYYSWGTYQYSCADNYSSLTKYCQKSNYGCNGYTDNLTILQPSDDAATAHYGGRMPTRWEWQELYNNCTSVWTTVNGVNGRRFTGPNGNSLFLPAAGYRWGVDLYLAGSRGSYWSSSLYTSSPYDAWDFFFDSGYTSMYVYYRRYYGHPVRAVLSAPQK